MTDDELYMLRALELAELGRGNVSPNPLVGCVIVKDNLVIGEGWHKKYGGPHAEVNAIEAVQNKELLKGAVLYVNLEPCAHFGKTPPCADLIIKYPFKKVVIANTDPNPKVSGKGIQKLIDAGIEVVSGVLEKRGEILNRRFFTFISKERPYVILKWAQTADGFIAKEDYDSKWISNPFSRQLVHKWRAEEDAILVGTNTANFDNPKLTVRDWTGKSPLRIVIDKYLNLKRDLHLFDGSTMTLCYNFMKDEKQENLEHIKADPAKDIISFILQNLQERNIQSVIVEGGSQLLMSFIKEHSWDEARIFKSNKNFYAGIPAPSLKGEVTNKEYVFEDELWFYKPYIFQPFI